jgi:hypothetical protein
MNRFLVFGLFGPPLGELVIFFVLMPLLQPFSLNLPAMLALLPVAYFTGVIPAMLVGLADHIAAHRGWRLRTRIPLCMAAGFVMAFFPILTSLMMGFIGGPWVLLFGVIGIVPGAICCWLADRWQRSPTAPAADRARRAGGDLRAGRRHDRHAHRLAAACVAFVMRQRPRGDAADRTSSTN